MGTVENRIGRSDARGSFRLVVAEADIDLLPLCSGRRWMRARRPELYGILVKRLGNELDSRQARFAEAPVEPIAAANRGESQSG
jgi:hypothetical protein